MPPRTQRSVSNAQGSPSNRIQSANTALRPLVNAAMGTTAKQPPRASCIGKLLPVSATARNEMEGHFERFQNRDRVDGVDALGPNGIQRLCGDLGITPGSFEMYTLVWKMGVTRSGCIPRADWLKTMYAYRIEQMLDLKMALSEWVEEARGDSFTDLYNDLYDYIRGDEARVMPSGVAVGAWKVLLQREPRIHRWIEWYSGVYKRDVTRDLWRQLEIFFSTVPTLDAYKVEGKWPSAIDSYLEWCMSSN